MLVAAMRTAASPASIARVQPALIALALLGLVAAHLIAPLRVSAWLLPAAYQRSGEVALILLPGTLAAFANRAAGAAAGALPPQARALLALDTVLLPFVALAYYPRYPRRTPRSAPPMSRRSIMLVRSAFVQGVALWSLGRTVAAEHE